ARGDARRARGAPVASREGAPAAKRDAGRDREARDPMHIRRATLIFIVAPFVVAIAAAYAQWATFGLPAVPAPVGVAAGPPGFPWWLRVSHYLNFFFLVVLVRSGLQILMDHPRLYWNVHSTPGTEWIRFTPVEVPRDRVYTSKDDARHLNGWM